MTNETLSREKDLIAEICQDEALLTSLLEKKRELTKNLHELDAKIYRLETSYLEDTRSTGNVVKGFDQYLIDQPNSSTHRGHSIEASDRIFTNSSARHFENRVTKDKVLEAPTKETERVTNATKAHPAANRQRNNGRAPRTSSPLVLRFPNPNAEKKQEQNIVSPTSERGRSRSPPRIRLVVRKQNPSDIDEAA